VEKLEERINRFVGHLRHLAEGDGENRGALADLRSGLGRAPAESPRLLKHVVPFLGERAHSADRWFYLVGALFGWHPRHEQGRSLAEGLGGLRQKGAISDSAGARFVALIASHPDDLPGRLREAIGLLRSNDIGLDWFQLLHDLTQWTHPDGYIQLKWARKFYRQARAPENNAA